MLNAYRYSRWDGTQEVNPFDPDEVMESLSDDLLHDGDVRHALERILQRGFQDPNGDRKMGLQQLLERLRQQRQQRLDRYDLGGIIDQIKEKLEDVLRTEREGIQRRLDQARAQPQQGQQSGQTGQQSEAEDATDEGDQQPQTTNPGQREAPRDPGQQGGQQSGQQSGQKGMQQSGPAQAGQSSNDDMLRMLENIAARKQQQLDELPKDVPGAIKGLNDYDFMDPEAREKFQELLQMLQQQMMQSYFQGMQQSMQSMTLQDMQAMREMLKELNQMLRDQAQGKEPENFENFMRKYGQNFPPGINNMDDLVQHLQERIGQMQSLMQSMSPEQRQQLQQMAEQLMDQAGMSDELEELASLLNQMSPNPLGQRQYPFRGDEPLSLIEAMQLMDELEDIDSLERQLQQARDLDRINEVDLDQLRMLLGEEAAQSMEQLQQLQKLLEEAGYIVKRGDQLELTARGMRKIGEKALHDIFFRLQRSSFGKHPIDYRGNGGERTDDIKQYEFGDPFSIDLQHTLMNSVVREGLGTPIRLTPDDFEVYRHELLTTSSTVIALDMSRSMFLRGCILAAKKVAVALNSLIKGLYPRDNLYIIAFSYIARPISTEDLPHLTWNEWGYGTNMQHAFMLSRQLLARHKGGTKQIILVTDGEPTAYYEPGSMLPEFNYPPTYRTFQETLREVGRCTRDDITINTFMMERGRYLTDFVDQMTRINKGRAFYATPDRLGEYILVDYVDNKRKTIR